MSTLNLAKVSYNWINVFTTNPFEPMLQEMYVVKKGVCQWLWQAQKPRPPTEETWLKGTVALKGEELEWSEELWYKIIRIIFSCQSFKV